MTVENNEGDITLQDVDTGAHLRDAQKFFGEEPKEEPKEKKAEGTPKEEPKEEPKLENPLDSILQSDEPKEEPKEESKEAEPDPLDELTEPKDEKAKAGWNELKTIAKEARTKAEALEAELQRIKESNTVDPEAHAATESRIKELEEANKQYSERLKLLDLKNHPDFQRQYVLPQEKKVQAISELVPEGTNIKAILDLPNREFASEISRLAEDMDDFSKAELYSASRDYRQTAAEATAALSNVDGTMESLNEANKARSKAVFDAVGQEFVKQQKFKPQEIPPDAPDEVKAQLEAYNQSYANVTTEAQNLAFGQTDEVGVAKMAHEAALFRFTMEHGLPRLGQVLSEQLNARDARIQELEAKIEKISAAKPNPGYGKEDGGGEKPTSEMSHLEAAQQYRWG
jgi:hypothetical protein